MVKEIINYYFARLMQHKLPSIDSLKKKLSSTDYMIIKTYEAKINNEDAPYSSDRMDEVMEERKNYRKKINELELLLDKAK